MRERLIDGLVQGDHVAWGAIGIAWAIATIVVLLHRPPPPAAVARGTAWTWLLFAVATGISLAGIPLAAAIAVPRLRWMPVDAPDLVAPAGEGWRKLRGPAVAIGTTDVAVPTVDADGHWVLEGLLAARRVAGLPAAEPAPLEPGGPHVCAGEANECRPWPVAWPDPAKPTAMGELVWSPEGAGDVGQVADALAYDVETRTYLRRVDRAPGAASGGPTLELVGRLAGEPPRGAGPALMFTLRRVMDGRLRAVRVVATPAPSGGAGHAFRMDRVDVSLTAGRRAFVLVARPLLVLTSLSLPLGVLVYLLAPWLRRRRSRREAAAWIAPYLEAFAVVAAGIAVAAPAVVAIASSWGSR